jgi:chemotaxis protein methyltransferase CheR
MNVTHEQLDRFKDLVYGRSSLSFPGAREHQLRHWLVQRTVERRHGSVDEYYDALNADHQEFERLLSLITTRETYFFRMPGHFEALRDTILPEITEREGKSALQALFRGESRRMQLRAWSAGCSTGQEAYSLAMQLLDAIRYPRAWDLSVLGTDINATAIETARQGQYEQSRLGSLPASFLERYFTPAASGGIEMSEEIRQMTSFQVMNLKCLPEQASFQNRFDIVFCRNVLIYFDLPAQQRLISALTDSLRPGGYLFTGEGEVLHLYQHDLDVIERDGVVFYRKPEGRHGCHLSASSQNRNSNRSSTLV